MRSELGREATHFREEEAPVEEGPRSGSGAVTERFLVVCAPHATGPQGGGPRYEAARTGNVEL